MGTLFSIGYTSYDKESFIKALKYHKIDVIADVRSSPYSAYYKDYNQNLLKQYLKEHSIMYVFLGKELGARPDDKSLYKNGVVNFEQVRKSTFFRSGLERLENGLSKYDVALLCAEKDPMQCHRSILICHELVSTYCIKHIGHKDIANEQLFIPESHKDLEKRLVKKHFHNQLSLIYDEKEMLNQAYIKHEKLIAYKENINSVEEID